MHIDEGELATTPHRTHACQQCGLLWAPATVPTVGAGVQESMKDLTDKQFTVMTLALTCQRHLVSLPPCDGRVLSALRKRGLLAPGNYLTKDGISLFKSHLFARLPASRHSTSELLIRGGFLTVRRLETPRIGVGPKELRFLSDVEVLRRFKGGWMRGFELTDKGEGYLEA